MEMVRERIARLGFDAEGVTPDEIRQAMVQRAEQFRDEAPTTAAEAAKVILDGVRKQQWRILIGKDALVRDAPEDAYGEAFIQKLQAQTEWNLG